MLKNNTFSSPVAIVVDEQSAGIGSRNNQWHSFKGNLYFSFAWAIKDLPKDMEIVSSSIYFSYILKELLNETGSKVWLKWPNDFYIGKSKVGGTVTQIIGENLVCGIGLNTTSASDDFAVLDVEIVREKLLTDFFNKLKKIPSWKKIFRNFSLEFDLSKKYQTHYNGCEISLEEAELNSDGSLSVGNKRIYSLR